MIDIDNIEVLARSATPGPWFFSPMTETVDPEISAANGPRIATLAAADITKANCAYIAAANPAAVMALIKELKSNSRMFLAACAELGAVNEKLGLDPNDGGAEPILNAIEELQAAALAAVTVLAHEPEHMDTEQSREYLVQFMEQHFTDTTYHRYICAEGGSNSLAGDFAWQLARALRMRSCQEQHVAAPVEHLSTVLEQAANLAIKFTAAPRDYLGPTPNAMKMQAALGEKIAAAIRALSVPLPTAAQTPQPMTAPTPAAETTSQIVADMRAARIGSALARLLASDPTTAACSEDDLSAAANDANAPPFVREQAAAMLEAREALVAAPAAQDNASGAARDVIAERRRQIEKEGYSHEHDDVYVNDEIASFAAFYVMPPAARKWPAEETGFGATWGEAIIPVDWCAAKPGDRRQELVKACALVIAEIERFDRAAIAASKAVKA